MPDYVYFRFDCSDLTGQQRDALVGEVFAQAEDSGEGGHPSVPVEEIDHSLDEALRGAEEDLRLLDAVVSHRQRCDRPDDPHCERCIVDSALARLAEYRAGQDG